MRKSVYGFLFLALVFGMPSRAMADGDDAGVPITVKRAGSATTSSDTQARPARQTVVICGPSKTTIGAASVDMALVAGYIGSGFSESYQKDRMILQRAQGVIDVLIRDKKYAELEEILQLVPHGHYQGILKGPAAQVAQLQSAYDAKLTELRRQEQIVTDMHARPEDKWLTDYLKESGKVDALTKELDDSRTALTEAQAALNKTIESNQPLLVQTVKDVIKPSRLLRVDEKLPLNLEKIKRGLAGHIEFENSGLLLAKGACKVGIVLATAATFGSVMMDAHSAAETKTKALNEGDAVSSGADFLDPHRKLESDPFATDPATTTIP